ncbi:MAG: GDP-mannose 4,6-dehydratase [Armatimonadota bacterium]|nr:MAG: GDP-mannose 4,6-dehydratase [Armatimonadota bacterium]
MRSLITGITGFVGSHLAEYLLAQGADVFGTARWRSSTSNIDHLEGRIELVECDIRDSASVKQVILDVRPDEIYHLAAQSFVPTSWRAPSETLETNIIGQVHILEAMRELDTSPRIQIAGSSEEYGMVYDNELPITETNPLRPLSPYAVSKVGQDLLGYQYFMTYGLPVIRTRAFNHTGPRRGSVFVTSNFAKQIADIEKGRQEPVIRVGNLDARRDFSDVRDIVRGYGLAVREGEPGEVYNLCSGRARTIREVLDTLLSLSTVEVQTEHDPSRMRPSDVPVLEGDYAKLHARTGWEPQIPFDQTARDLLDYWRNQP